MIIDWQHHFSPEEVFRKRGGKPGQAVIKDGKVGMHLREEVYQIDKQLEFMNAAGIDMAVLSTTLDSVKGDRFWTELGATPPLDKPYKESFRKYFNKIYFDMAGFEGGMSAVKCALTTISPERLMFGTDYPYNFTNDPQGVRDYIENIRRLDLSPESIEAILGGNAARLLGL